MKPSFCHARIGKGIQNKDNGTGMQIDVLSVGFSSYLGSQSGKKDNRLLEPHNYATLHLT